MGTGSETGRRSLAIRAALATLEWTRRALARNVAGVVARLAATVGTGLLAVVLVAWSLRG